MKMTANLTKLLKNIGIILLAFLVISGLFTLFSSPFDNPEKISLTQLAEKVNQGQVKEITVTGNKLSVTYQNEEKARSLKEKGVALSETLMDYGVQKKKLNRVQVAVEQQTDWGWLGIVGLGLAPLLLFGFFFWMMFKQAKGKSMKAMDFSKTKARLFGEEGKTPEQVSFEDVGGLEEAKDELDEVVEFLKNPNKFLKMGAQIPRGVLLMGPPGTGKTLLAKAIAHQADVPFYSISGSEFIELFVGVGASVTGDTPILVRDEDSTKLVPIEQFVDQYYEDEQGEEMISVSGVETLGYQPLDTNFNGASGDSPTKFFGESNWQDIKGVYRHQVDHIYEIDYLGGKLRTTGDHSVFVRSHNFITAKPVRELEQGDILVNLPFKVRGKFKPGVGTTHKVKAHQFEQRVETTLPVWNENSELEKAEEKYELVRAKRGEIAQHELAEQLGVTQGAIGKKSPPSGRIMWQRGESKPRALWLAEQYLDKGIPQQVEVSPELMRLLGYYAAEGRTVNYMVQFTFGSHEKKLHRDCIDLFKEIFNCEPNTEETEDNSLRISFHGKPLMKFFDKHCGTGSHNKHVPQFLWDLPQQYFLEFLKGYTKGDGYTTQEEKLVAGSVSKQLILELAWLSAMHGIQVGIGEKYNKPGRVIKKEGEPLPGGKYWLLTIGKTSHPFREEAESPKQFKKPYVQQVTKKDYDGYVYDLCGCENEAFFGGEKPTLLHNSRVRDLFDKAKKNQPSIIFIDEVDAIGRTRGAGVGGGHDEREQTLNQILSEMDGFEEKSTCVVMGASNRPDVLDPALLRPGRFDRRVTLSMPDIKAREEILNIHAREKPLAEETDLREVAERTPGFSGADLENVVNEAAILAAQKNQHIIKQNDLLEAIERVLLGRERKSHILSDQEKKIAAYHEAGHALLTSLLPKAESVRKISIIARGPSAGGYTLKTPEEEKMMKSKSEFLAELTVLLGGYSAEKLKFDEITTGASNDLEQASKLAKKLVKKYGMSDLGPISYGGEKEAVFLGKEMAEAKDYSEQVAAEIDEEISQFVNQAQDKATELLNKNKELLDKIAETLIEKETIEKEEFKELVEKAET